MPLHNLKYEDIPISENHPGSFGYKRKYHFHEGVDLYAPIGEPAYSMDYGEVVWWGLFTGDQVGTPWWEETYAVAIKHSWGVMFYGELSFNKDWKLGYFYKRDEPLGKVAKVLKHDKGNGCSMLHLELYIELPETLPPMLWVDKKPKGLIDPTLYILARIGEIENLKKKPN